MIGVSPVTLTTCRAVIISVENISTSPVFNQMLGFSKKMCALCSNITRKQGKLHGDIEEMILEMKPWYDNYCFARQSLSSDPKMFNCDMVLYYLSESDSVGSISRTDD